LREKGEETVRTQVLKKEIRFRRPKAACSLSYVEYRPNKNVAKL
jgi:hypothetical protein